MFHLNRQQWSWRRPMKQRLERFTDKLRPLLGSLWARTILSIAIISSLLPSWEPTAHFQKNCLPPILFVIFLIEFVARLFLVFRSDWDEDHLELTPAEEGWRWPSPAALVLLGLDGLVLASFTSLVGESATALRLVRLLRWIALFGYWAPLMPELWALLTRRERGRQLAMLGLAVMCLSVVGGVGHSLLETQTLPSVDDVWWSFKKLENSGNLVEKLTSPSLPISLLLTLCGLLLVSFLIGLGTDLMRELMELSHVRAPGLARHTVIVNIRTSARPLLEELMRHYRKRWKSERRQRGFGYWLNLFGERLRGAHRYVVVGHAVKTPPFLREPEFARVSYRFVTPDDQDDALLTRTDLLAARRVVLLANHALDRPDDDTILTILQIIGGLAAPNGNRKKNIHLIAEIIDESNIPAARKAIAKLPHGERVYAQLIDTERLLALFAACLARQPRVRELLIDLLHSRGHEIYTYDHGYRGGTKEEGKLEDFLSSLGSQSTELSRLFAAGGTKPRQDRVIPIGVLEDTPESSRSVRDVRVWLNCPQAQRPPPRAAQPWRVCGLVGVAPNFHAMWNYTHSLVPRSGTTGAGRGSPPDPDETPEGWFERAVVSQAKTVLVCGFRPATVYLVESLLATGHGTKILVLVDDEDVRSTAKRAFEAHGQAFEPRHPASRAYGLVGRPRATVEIAVDDWSSVQTLEASVCNTDEDIECVVMLADHVTGDARTATTLMRLEALLDAHPRAHRPRVVAELCDKDFARQLIARYQLVSGAFADIQIFSSDEMRSLFMFQSVAVPYFDKFYGALMDGRGQRLTAMEPRSADSSQKVTFAELFRYFQDHGAILVAVESNAGLQIAGYDDELELRDIQRCWTICGRSA